MRRAGLLQGLLYSPRGTHRTNLFCRRTLYAGRCGAYAGSHLVRPTLSATGLRNLHHKYRLRDLAGWWRLAQADMDARGGRTILFAPAPADRDDTEKAPPTAIDCFLAVCDGIAAVARLGTSGGSGRASALPHGYAACRCSRCAGAPQIRPAPLSMGVSDCAHRNADSCIQPQVHLRLRCISRFRSCVP